MKTNSKKAFVSAFILLLQDKSLEDIQTIEIIKKSGYGKSSFYRSYGDKYDLLSQLTEQEAETFGTSLALNTAEFSPEDRDHQYLIALHTMRHVKENYRLYHMIFNNEYEGMGIKEFSKYAVRAFSNARIFTQKAFIEGMDMDLYYYCETQRMIQIISYWDAHHFEETPEYMAEQIVKMNGILI